VIYYTCSQVLFRSQRGRATNAQQDCYSFPRYSQLGHIVTNLLGLPGKIGELFQTQRDPRGFMTSYSDRPLANHMVRHVRRRLCNSPCSILAWA